MVGKADDKIQHNTVMNCVSYFFVIIFHLSMTLHGKLGDLHEMKSYRANENKAVLLFLAA